MNLEKEVAGPLNKMLSAKIRESLASVMPITLIVLALCVSITPVSVETLMLFLAGAALLILGMGFFTLGADMAMMPIGETLGEKLTRSRRLGLIVPALLVIGVIITLAEPDLAVLARQTPGVPDRVLILTVAVGVGCFLALSFLRIFLRWPLNRLLMLFYLAVFVLAAFTPKAFQAVAFDSGGVTTGPITVPFIMALGLGLTAVRGDQNADDDAFGLVALCSIGPILSVLLLGMLYQASGGSYTPLSIPSLTSTQDLWRVFGEALPVYVKEVGLALAPIFVFFGLFQLISLKLKRKALARILIGGAYSCIGLTLFLTGVNVGFMPAGYAIGSQLARLPYNWILIPLGMLIGFFIVKAEPAVAVLNKQVEQITGGTISQRAMMTALSAGMALSLGLSMLRVLTGLPILWVLLPGYALALGLSFAVPKIFTAIAFDSGGVASGPMTATFLLPFAMGACDALGGDILTDAFGIVAMVAMTPLITLQILGLIYRFKTQRANR
jgi:hypothetical protein